MLCKWIKFYTYICIYILYVCVYNTKCMCIYIHTHRITYTHTYIYNYIYIRIYIYIHIRHPHFTFPEKSRKPSAALQQLTAAQSGLVDGKVLERAAGTFGDFLLHFLRKLLLEVRALVQVDQHQGDLVIWRFPMGILPNHPLIDGIFHGPSSEKGVPPWLRKPPFVCQKFRPERRWSYTQTDPSFEQCSKPFDYTHHTRWFRTECRVHRL